MFTPFESLFWVKLKAPWPVSPRDFTGISLRDLDDDVCYVSMSSVEDPAVPPVSGCVRGNLIISGWKIYKTDGGIGITYITQVDMAGSIPSSFLKSIHLQVPLCAGKVADYVTSYGCPPYTIEATATYTRETFDHSKRELTIELAGEGQVTWKINRQMYPNGVKVSGAEADFAEDNVTVKVSGPTTVKINKA